MRTRSILVLAIAGFCAAATLCQPHIALSQNRVELSINNRRSAGGVYTAELWARIPSSVNSWSVGAFNIILSYNENALNPIAYLNQEAFLPDPAIHNTGNYMLMTQTQGPGFLSLNALSLTSPFAVKTDSFRIAAYRWDIIDGSQTDDLTFGSTSLSSLILHASTFLTLNGGPTNGYSILNPTPRIIESPIVVQQPMPVEACEGSSSSMSVSAVGANLGYQWQKFANSAFQDIIGATASTLTFSVLTDGDDGNYRVRVTDNNGMINFSNAASVAVWSVPVIFEQPVDAQACVGQTAEFVVDFENAPPATIQWQQRQGPSSTWIDIADATMATLQIPNVSPANNGRQYRAVIDNLCGTVSTTSAELFSVTPVRITQEPDNKNATIGSSATFSVAASGVDIAYQWNKNGVDIPGATAATLTLTQLQPVDAGEYSVAVSGVCGFTELSTNASLTVLSPNTNVFEILAFPEGYWNGATMPPTAVIVELRIGASLAQSSLAFRTAAMMSQTGTVSAKFETLTPGDYWVVVRHGGHLPVGSASTVTTSASDLHYALDFTDPAQVHNGAVALKTVNLGGVDYRVLTAGDLNADRNVLINDALLLGVPNIGLFNPGQVPPVD